MQLSVIVNPGRYAVDVDGYKAVITISSKTVRNLGGSQTKGQAITAICASARMALASANRGFNNYRHLQPDQISIAPVRAAHHAQRSSASSGRFAAHPVTVGGNPECRCDTVRRCPVHDA